MYVVVAMIALVVGIVLGVVVARAGTRSSAGQPVALHDRAGSGSHTDMADQDRIDVPTQVLDALGEGVVVVDRGDGVLFANPAARALGALAGDRLSTEDLRHASRTALDSGQVHRTTVSLPHGFLGRDLLPVSVSSVPIGPVNQHRAQAVALLLADITESRRLEAVRRDFVANVSHELKTPVGALTLLAEAIQDAADDPVAVQRFAARMEHEGQRLGRLVGELIALSRVQGADALPDLKPVSVTRLLAEAVDRTRLAADKVAITLAVSVEEDLGVLGDEAQLTTAVANLADNAVSYSPGGTRVVLTARAVHDQDGEWVEIVVADQGIGIAEADLDRIFERFYRVDPARSRATGGTGLGLAIVKHVVTNHGGTVSAWSSEGAGSTFTLRLPRAPVAANAAPKNSAIVEPGLMTPPLSTDPAGAPR